MFIPQCVEIDAVLMYISHEISNNIRRKEKLRKTRDRKMKMHDNISLEGRFYDDNILNI